MALSIGDSVPDFNLKNANYSKVGEFVNLQQSMKENGLIIMFECNHCPYVVGSIDRINLVAEKAESLEIGFIGINSNDSITYSSDSFENMTKRAVKGMPYPYLFDETQQVAKSFGAKRTPEFYLFDGKGDLVYSGRMDDSPKDPNQVKSTELSNAIDSIIDGRKPDVQETESIGCSVKWKV